MAPWSAWGQILPRWFKEPVLIANYAESGETTASFIGERRWPKLLTELHPGDYVLMQFGINDRRIPLDRFKQYFVQFIIDTRAKNATPILVTSQNLKKLDADGNAVQTLAGYPDAMRQVAADQKVPLIDLNQMSLDLYTAIGPDNLNHTFVDGTHQTDYGAYELAKCVITGLLANKIPFTQYLTDDWKPFDPTHPDPLTIITFPTDPQLDPARPGGPGAKNGIGPMAGTTSTRPTSRPPSNVCILPGVHASACLPEKPVAHLIHLTPNFCSPTTSAKSPHFSAIFALPDCNTLSPVIDNSVVQVPIKNSRSCKLSILAQQTANRGM